MRKLSPVKAVSHALKSVLNYRAAALRIGLFWIPLFLVMDVAAYMLIAPAPPGELSGPGLAVQLVFAAVGLVGFCSMAVSWHRFILRDELGPPARLDAHVWRYLGNSIQIMLMVVAPVLAIEYIFTLLPPAVSVLFLPVAIVAGTVAIRLSIRLPAVALGRTDFSFRDAWQASDGNFWQIAVVAVLNAAIILVVFVVLMIAVGIMNRVGSAAAPLVALLLGPPIKLFLILFSASIFTSLYGFFVERRDF